MRDPLLHSRRRFLRSSIGGATAIGIGAAVPDCLGQAAAAQRGSGERILVVVQLTGGNDGLNTVVPYRDDAYYAAREKLAIRPGAVLKHDDAIGFHPSLRSMQDLMQQGSCAVVQGVGYDRPNRSHFESMDIWHTCRRKDEERSTGWLGRYLDTHAAGSGGDVPALHLGEESQPLALAARDVRVPTVKRLSEFQLHGSNRKNLRSILKESRDRGSRENGHLLSFLESSTTAAMEASVRVAEAATGVPVRRFVSGDFPGRETPCRRTADRFRVVHPSLLPPTRRI